MLRAIAQPHYGTWDTMTTRSAALITIALLAALLAFVALAALFTSDISERAGGIVTTVLSTFATVLAGLLLFLRVETVAQKASEVETKVEAVHQDVLNGPMRENVKKAISEDRHAQRNRDTVLINKDQLEALKRRAAEREGQS